MTVDEKVLENWEIYPLPVNNTKDIKWNTVDRQARNSDSVPSFYYGEFSSHVAKDTFLKTSLWTKVRHDFKSYF